MTEHVLDAENWRLEAQAIRKDIEKHVSNFEILDGTDQLIHFKITTLEKNDFLIELSARGFRVVGSLDREENYYETPYSLLSGISPSFHQSFGNELLEKLNKLNET